MIDIIDFKLLFIKDPSRLNYNLAHIIEGDFTVNDFDWIIISAQYYLNIKLQFDFNQNFLIIEGKFDKIMKLFKNDPIITIPKSLEIIKYLFPEFYEQLP